MIHDMWDDNACIITQQWNITQLKTDNSNKRKIL